MRFTERSVYDSMNLHFKITCPIFKLKHLPRQPLAAHLFVANTIQSIRFALQSCALDDRFATMLLRNLTDSNDSGTFGQFPQPDFDDCIVHQSMHHDHLLAI